MTEYVFSVFQAFIVLYTLLKICEWSLSPSGNHVMWLIKLFPAGNASVLEIFFLDQERKIPGNTEIPKVIPDRKILISELTGFPAGYGELLLLSLTVYRCDGFLSLHYYTIQTTFITSDNHSKYISLGLIKIINHVPAVAVVLTH